jgi:alanine racemase
MTTSYRCWTEISLKQIAENFYAVRELVTPAVEVMPVLKADACGHGAMEVSRTLCECGTRWFAVSNAEEALKLRNAGINARILLLAGFLPWEQVIAIENDLTPVLHDLDCIAEWDRLNRKRQRIGKYHLKIDSGMWSLGTRAAASEIASAIRSYSHSAPEGLMTHFASAADYGNNQTEEQISYFLRLAGELAEHGIRPRYLHLSGTVPVAYGRMQAWQSLVRPGHAIYGYVAPASGPTTPDRILNVNPALTWKASILAVKDVPTGARIGYRGMFEATKPMRIAILAAGYADGIPHQLANRGMVIAGGKLAPILGAIAMDLTTVDITPSPHLQTGDPVTLLGSEGNVSIDAQQIGQMAGTSSYSVLCGISPRVTRLYI